MRVYGREKARLFLWIGSSHCRFAYCNHPLGDSLQLRRILQTYVGRIRLDQGDDIGSLFDCYDNARHIWHHHGTHKCGPRLTIFLGGFLLGLGIFLTSRLTSIGQLYLFFGFMAGMGMGAAYVPPMVVVTRWVVKRRGLALGIVAAGTGLGATIFPPLSRYLIFTYNWRTATLTLL